MSESGAAVRLAATVLLVREGDGALEVYMQKRHAEMPFAASAHIFPGGSLDEADGSDAALGLLGGADWRATAARMGLGSGAEALRRCAALHVCAIREVAEETGVLLARPAGGGRLGALDAARVRARLVGGGDFITELAAAGLRPAVEELTFVAHFITPVGLPRRYDTHFFVAAAPPEQEFAVSGGEATEDGWYTSAAVLAAEAAGSMMLMRPTSILCAELGRHRDLDSLRADLGTRPVPAILFDLRRAMEGPIPDHLPTAAEVAALEAPG